MLSNAYFLAKFRFDTAKNEPAKNLQKFLIFPNLLTLTPTKKLLCEGLRQAQIASVQRSDFEVPANQTDAGPSKMRWRTSEILQGCSIKLEKVF